jgi:HPt (histidine-containing phosphotransfer) domain-containing protein
MTQVRECLERREQKSADIMIHTLKGVSAIIGADAVAVQVALLETAISRDDSAEHIETLLLACSETFDQWVSPWRPAWAPTIPRPAVQPTPPHHRCRWPLRSAPR